MRISSRRFGLLGWGLLLAGALVAPVPPGPKPGLPAALAQARRDAAAKQFVLTWQYYQQSREGSFNVYVWSRLLLDAERGPGTPPAEQVAACTAHLERMKALETLIARIRRIGFGRSSDVGASAYYRIEAECWLAEAKAL